MSPLAVRNCSKCGVEKPLTSGFFHRAGTGFRGACRCCMSDYHEARADPSRARRCRRSDVPIGHRRCSKCREIKPRTTEFWHRRKAAKDGLYEYCKPCHVAIKKKVRRPRIRRFTRREIVARYSAKPRNRISRRIASRMRRSLRREGGPDRWEQLLGYSRAELAAHLEGKFCDGMGWHNMDEWHIDHVRPISSFSFKTKADPEFLECWSLNNLQPLWALDNLRKSKTWTAAVK